MAVYELEKTHVVNNPGDQIVIKIDHNNLIGTESYHIIDIPENSSFFDHEWRNEGNVIIGRGHQFIGKAIKVYTKGVNLKADVESIDFNYWVNDSKCYEHSKPKAEDTTPAIILTIKFVS